MSTSGKPMTTLMPQAVRLLTVWLAVALIGPQPFARAQAAPGGSPARASVLPTGGGQALLDPSDTVIWPSIRARRSLAGRAVSSSAHRSRGSWCS
jgi:hypothetical protein